MNRQLSTDNDSIAVRSLSVMVAVTITILYVKLTMTTNRCRAVHGTTSQSKAMLVYSLRIEQIKPFIHSFVDRWLLAST